MVSPCLDADYCRLSMLRRQALDEVQERVRLIQHIPDLQKLPAGVGEEAAMYGDLPF